ncbi:MAG TPA: ABC-F family ATP-binding cassette domain-containing protein [Candidatus Limnocylindrales bacterium]|nr:ABC-F family ATP-binding cassette domain-containing protein [Candidatus Limnocylindrales bacterium]
MAVLLGCQDLTKAYGAVPLFTGVSFGIHDGDRVGMVGPNGCGKSTLLRLLAGIEAPDRGAVTLRRLTRLAYLPQHPSFRAATAAAVLESALHAIADDRAARQARVRAMLGRCGFTDPEVAPATLSGGWQKRLAIAEALITEPDVLLLDEPTNHLDLDGILWLESLLTSQRSAFIVVSHDRWFLENVAQRMFDLDPVHDGGFFETRGRYSEFLERKDAALTEQARWQATLANRVRREVEWLRRGPKARTTKQQARIEEAGRLMEELSDVSARLDRRATGIDFRASDRRTRRLLVAEDVAKSFGDRTIVRDASIVLAPGTRLGLLGPNGSGKSTLIRLLVGELEPDSGRIERADGLRVSMLDQHRTALDPSLTLRRALAPAGDQVIFAGRPVHVAGWAQRFLFRSEQLAMPVGKLSGGEQARVLLASLMLQPADVLVLDEPTNDLDIPTLEVLEESLLEFPGAVVLVTHDRYLFERVTNTVLGLDGSGRVVPYADYRQWEATRRQRPAPAAARKEVARETAPPSEKARPRKLSYHEQREWDAMEETIVRAEEMLAQAQQRAADPAIASDAAEVAVRYRQLEEAQAEVERLYARWSELEDKRSA